VTPEGIKKLIETFAELGITQPQIEARIQRRLDAIRPAQVVMLRKIYTSLKDGMSEPADWFEAVALAQPEAEAQAQPQRRQRRTRGLVDEAALDRAAPLASGNEPEPPPEQPAPPPSGRRQVQFEV
jgi:hypothetical protein